MSADVLKEFSDELRHTGEEIDLLAYLMPPNRGMGSIWVYLLNMILPFIKIKEKDSYYLLCASTKSKRAFYLHLGYKADELFDKKVYELGDVSNLNIVPNAEKYEQKVSFTYRGAAEGFTLLEYPFGGEWTTEQRQAFQTMAKQIAALFSGNTAATPD